MSGVRGSPSGGSPGALKSCVIAGPEKISPMPAILAVAGDCVSSMVTAVSVVHWLLNHTSETSSSVGPMPLELAGDSDVGKQFSRMVAGDVVTGSFAVVDMPRYREESIGLWPCLAEMMIKVESRSPRAFRAATIFPIEASAN